MHGFAPNDIRIQFKDNPRLGRKTVVPPLFKESQQSISTQIICSEGFETLEHPAH